MRTCKIFFFTGLILLAAFQYTANTGCRKPKEVVKTDTITPPPPPPLDTVSLVRKLEVLTSLYPGYGIAPYRTYSFYYDNQKRLTSVGIKNYSIVLYDSLTTQLEYNGNSKMPSRIIMPDINASKSALPPNYDSTWFFYTSDGKMQKDSCNDRYSYTQAGGYVRKPMIHLNSYPDSLTKKTDWYIFFSGGTSLQYWRADTVKLTAGGKIDSIKTVYIVDPLNGNGAYAKAHAFTYSPYINPLAKLNISGTHYSLLYGNVKKELLGNNSHPMVYGSNGFADYLDFISPYIPTLFYIGAYNKNHQMIGSSSAAFAIEIAPWAMRPAYPSEIKVTMSTSLAGDKYIYRYTY